MFLPSDKPRLTNQMHAIRDLMADGNWRTLEQIQEAIESQGIKCRTASASAQLRNLKKPEGGSYGLEKRHEGNGQYRYRLVPPAPAVVVQRDLFGAMT